MQPIDTRILHDAQSTLPILRGSEWRPQQAFAQDNIQSIGRTGGDLDWEYHSTNSYELGRLLGNGSFGVVSEAKCQNTEELVAIKKVLQDPRYKNRELDVMRELRHTNIVLLKDYFFTETCINGEDQRFLNLVMEFIPDTIYRVLKSFTRSNQPMPILLVRLYIYQLCRGLAYLHSLGVCHRDVKPHNLLVDIRNQTLKLCDFGSAKRLVPREPSVAYICSRFYRAPELMLGATEYTTAIDIWSIGCVMGELLLGRPLFSGETSVDQLVKIIQVLGTPSQRQMQLMNPQYTEFQFPEVKPKEWRKIMNTGMMGGVHIPAEAIDLLSGLLKYEPLERISPLKALTHPFFDSLRQRTCTLPDGTALPELFNFSKSEIQNLTLKDCLILIPEWHPCRRTLNETFLQDKEDNSLLINRFTKQNDQDDNTLKESNPLQQQVWQ